MTPEEKGQEIVDGLQRVCGSFGNGIAAAIICCEEILKALPYVYRKSESNVEILGRCKIIRKIIVMEKFNWLCASYFMHAGYIIFQIGPNAYSLCPLLSIYDY